MSSTCIGVRSVGDVAFNDVLVSSTFATRPRPTCGAVVGGAELGKPIAGQDQKPNRQSSAMRMGPSIWRGPALSLVEVDNESGGIRCLTPHAGRKNSDRKYVAKFDTNFSIALSAKDTFRYSVKLNVPNRGKIHCCDRDCPLESDVAPAILERKGMSFQFSNIHI